MRRIIFTIIATLVLTSCGGGSDTAAADVSGSLNISGGIAGIDDTWLLADGVLTTPDGTTVALSDAQIADFRAQIVDAGFMDLDAEYLPDDPCCDRFTYLVTIELDGRVHTVTIMDGVDAPAGLSEIIETIRSAGS